MDLAENLVIKAQLHDDIRRVPIHNEEITYNELILMMQRLFVNKINLTDDIVVKYKDEDGDYVTIMDDSDILLAVRSSKVLNIKLYVNNKSQNDLKGYNALINELRRIAGSINELADRINLNSSESNDENGEINCRNVENAKEFDPISNKTSRHENMHHTETALNNTKQPNMINDNASTKQPAVLNCDDRNIKSEPIANNNATSDAGLFLSDSMNSHMKFVTDQHKNPTMNHNQVYNQQPQPAFQQVYADQSSRPNMPPLSSSGPVYSTHQQPFQAPFMMPENPEVSKSTVAPPPLMQSSLNKSDPFTKVPPSMGPYGRLSSGGSPLQRPPSSNVMPTHPMPPNNTYTPDQHQAPGNMNQMPIGSHGMMNNTNMPPRMMNPGQPQPPNAYQQPPYSTNHGNMPLPPHPGSQQNPRGPAPNMFVPPSSNAPQCAPMQQTPGMFIPRPPGANDNTGYFNPTM